MPHIGVTMERSLQNGGSWGTAFADLLSRSAAAALGRRQSIDGISNDISDAATAFSSWDNCFQASICKYVNLTLKPQLYPPAKTNPYRWPRSKYLDEPFVPPNHDQAYRSQAPMHSGFESAKPSMPSAPSVPQYAEFDTGNKKDADALPAMPSWEDASSKKVLIEEEYVEMEPLKKKDPLPNSSQMNVANMPSSTSPRAVSPYGPPAGTGGSNGYMTAGRNEASPYGMNQQGYNDYDNQGYDQQYPSNGMNNAAIGAAGVQVGRRTPHQDYNNGQRWLWQ
ncbi:hypothetical protein NPX13_g11336 [Xylaria arbuscula]|uniref:Uncharacterized protein n=1 Tax=Xylaria arbuscula TaxID=114810 RepID=A0A9W8N2W3_9PEZI|nr:hypothetical protein NPX13_g11336 [Xylaria arbuscula]